MTSERRQFDYWHLVRQVVLAGLDGMRAVWAVLRLVVAVLRKAAHWTLVPYLWTPSHWQRSPLSRASSRLAFAAVDLLLLLLPVGLVIGWLW